MGDSNFITSSELSELRTKEFQMETGDSLLIIDRLEEQGILRAHEYIGGCLCGARVFIGWECPTCGRGFHNEVRQNPEDR